MTRFARYRRRPNPVLVPDQQPTGPVDDAPSDDITGLTAWQASRWAEIQGASPHGQIGHGRARTELVAGLRALADFLEANPAAPIPAYGHDLIVTTSGSDEQKRSQVKFASLAIGKDVRDDTQSGHYSTECRFGRVGYRIVAISEAAMQRYQRTQKLNHDPDQEPDRFSSPEDNQ